MSAAQRFPHLVTRDSLDIDNRSDSADARAAGRGNAYELVRGEAEFVAHGGSIRDAVEKGRL